MKKTTTLLLLALTFSAVGANAQDKNSQTKPVIDTQSKEILMKQFDKDGNGKLDVKERMAAMKAIKSMSSDLDELKQKHVDNIIKRFDKDGDQKLDKTELISFLDEQRNMFEKRRHKMHPKHKFQPPKEILKEFDKDGDGKLNSEERKAMFKKMKDDRDALIKKYDANGDGVLSEEERDKLIEDPEVKKHIKRMFSRQLRQK